MVIHALEQALQTLDIDSCTPDPWNTTVSTKAVQAASAIIHHFNQQKFIMLGIGDDGENVVQATLSSCMSRLLCASWKTDDGMITTSEVSQKHIYEKVGQSYPSAKAVELL